MAADVEMVEEPDILVESPEVSDGGGTDAPGTKGMVSKALGGPMARTRGAISWFRRLTLRDRIVVLLGILIILVATTIILIQAGGGGGDGSDGPTIVSNWNTDSLTIVPIGNQEPTLVNLEGQNTPFPVVLDPLEGEVFFITRLTAHVEWVDESTPPAQVPSVGYNTNEPDGFQLLIKLEDGRELESELVYNSQGQPGVIDLTWDLEEPIPVADVTDAKYLPKGYNETFRIDFIVHTDECGDWPPPDRWRPNIGDAGNAFDFTWSVEYLYDNDGTP